MARIFDRSGNYAIRQAGELTNIQCRAMLAVVTAVEVIEEIKGLSPAERDQVVRFIHALEQTAHRRLSADELGRLADRFVDAKDPSEIDRLNRELLVGFYSQDRNA